MFFQSTFAFPFDLGSLPKEACVFFSTRPTLTVLLFKESVEFDNPNSPTRQIIAHHPPKYAEFKGHYYVTSDQLEIKRLRTHSAHKGNSGDSDYYFEVDRAFIEQEQEKARAIAAWNALTPAQQLEKYRMFIGEQSQAPAQQVDSTPAVLTT